MRILFHALVVITVLTACQTRSNLLATPTPKSIFEVATPVPTITNFETINSYPMDSFLFVAVNYAETCSEKCDCVVYEAMRSAFRFEADTLFLVKSAFDDLQSDWRDYRRNNDVIALYGYWGPAMAGLFPLDALPSNLPNTNLNVVGVNKNEDLLLKTGYGIIMIKKGEAGFFEWVEYKENDCQILHSSKLTNYGLIDDHSVVIEE